MVTASTWPSQPELQPSHDVLHNLHTAMMTTHYHYYHHVIIIIMTAAAAAAVVTAYYSLTKHYWNINET